MVKDIQSWQILVKRLPINIHNFCCRYLVMNLANNSNLKRWKISNSELCSLCTKKQTQLHALHRARPDIAIETRDTLTVIELTCPRETCTTKSHDYKETRYKEIKSELLTPPSNFQLIFLEVTSLGFVTRNIKTF